MSKYIYTTKSEARVLIHALEAEIGEWLDDKTWRTLKEDRIKRLSIWIYKVPGKWLNPLYNLYESFNIQPNFNSFHTIKSIFSYQKRWGCTYTLLEEWCRKNNRPFSLEEIIDGIESLKEEGHVRKN